MPYAIVVEQQGTSLEEYRKVTELLGDRGEGHLVHIVGEIEGGLRFIDVWETQQHAERFQFERLFPAFIEVFGSPPEPARLDAMETAVVDIGARA